MLLGEHGYFNPRRSVGRVTRVERRRRLRRRAAFTTLAASSVVAVMAFLTILTPARGTFVLAETGPSHPALKPMPAPPTVNLSFVGDVLLGGTVGELIQNEGAVAPWELVKEALSGADLTCANLECPVGTTGSPVPDKTWTFRAAPKSLQGLKESGIDVVSLANNHALDYGEDCLKESLDLLEKAGIHTIGAGANEKEARKPFIFEKNGVKVGLLATSVVVPDTSWAADEKRAGLAVDYDGWYPGIIASIEALRDKVDAVIVMVHWGEERTTTPVDWIGPIARDMRKAGANVIIGTHPHVLEGVSFDGQDLTAYSLGNFVFSTRPEIPACQEGMILNLAISKQGILSASMIPSRIVWGKTVLPDQGEREDTIRKVASMSRPFGTDVNQNGEIFPLLFCDMDNHWARFSVAKMVSRGVISGYEDGTFMPEKDVTKGEFAAMLARLVASPSDIRAVPAPQGFNLTTKEHWSYPYLSFLAAREVIPADSDWNPDEACSRLYACLALWRSQGAPAPALSGEVATGGADQTANRYAATAEFKDAKEIPEAYLGAVAWAVENKLLKGCQDGTLSINRALTRAEAVEMLLRRAQE